MTDLAAVLALWKDDQRPKALAALQQLLEREPDHVDGLRFLCEVQIQAGQATQAERTLRTLIRLVPKDAGLWRQLGSVLLALRDLPNAIQILQHAIVLDPDNSRAYNNLGLALLRAGDPLRSLQQFSDAITRDPAYALAWFNQGLALETCGRLQEAANSHRSALEREPHLAAARERLATLQQDQDPAESQRESWRAVESRAVNFMTAGRHTEARAHFSALIDSGADLPFLEGLRFHCELWDCDWSRYPQRHSLLESRVRDGQRADMPFTHFVHSDSASGQRRCAEIFVQARHPDLPAGLIETAPGIDPRITVAYVSSEFRQHATSYLIAGLLEAHDRTRFRIIGATFGPEDDSPMRARIRAATDEFIDVNGLTDADACALLRRRGVQIAVDLKGHSGGARTGLFARRLAPIQVNYLGYPGTLGATFYDYIVADRVVIPRDHRQFYSENVVELPGCYQPNDTQRPRPVQGPGREAYGLPAQGLVLCCFNHLYKLSPAIFDIWLRVLAAVDGSVLWLLQGSEAARRNLRDRAAAAGIEPGRLLFAPHLDQERHLSRYRHVDLFLDTWPCNAHTSASDALWMGVPLITYTGGAFPSRVATSLLQDLGLPELCASTLADYEASIIRLATDREARSALWKKLQISSASAGTFDSSQYCRNLERAYTEMWARFSRGEKPAPIELTAI